MTSSVGRTSARVARLRTGGDAWAERGDPVAARTSWEEALDLVSTWLAGSDGLDVTPADRANMLGVKGGLERRLGDTAAALASYRTGAAIEADAGLTATYNRANEIKLGLIADEASTVDLLQDKLVALRDALMRRFVEDERARDDAWLWADLGDVQLLLGEQDAAEDAYRTFGDKAQSSSPASTLRVIKEVAAALRSKGDVAAVRVSAAVASAEELLSA